MSEHESIAVIGMAANLPKSPDLEAFWQNLVNGVECMTDLSYEDVLARGEAPDQLRNPRYVFRRPLMVDMEYFDAELFGMTPREAELRDPQHRLFLQTCFSALEHAGHDPARYPGSVGLYAGINENRYVDLHLRPDRNLVDTVGGLAVDIANHPDYVTTFTSYKLGLRGPSMTISTACSSSLVSVHQACQALRLGECDMALAGGVEVEWPYGVGYVYVPGSIHSSNGYCRPFDVRADGTVFGSGVGAVLLKRTEDAIADGDTIYAVIRGSAVNNDGADRVGFSAPSATGQAACIADALTAASVDPGSISYVEAHGTATQLGDPIEIAALGQAFRELGGEQATGFCGIGSVKSNLGHLGPASGVAGLIKTVLALHRELLPPSINFTEPNPKLGLERTPFEVVTEPRAWPRSPTVPRRAGVSSFGIGGTNAHVVLEEAPASEPDEDQRGPELLVLSASTAEALARLREKVGQHVTWSDVALRDVGHTLRAGRRAMGVREAVVADTSLAAASAFTSPADGSSLSPAEIVFAFPGQGSQHPRMALGPWTFCARFRNLLDEVLGRFSDLLGRDFHALWRAEDPAVLADTAVSQPLLFSVEYALSRFLLGMGLPVAAVIGHSLGEVVAGTVAGVFSPDDAIRIVAERARLMAAAPPGAMAAVAISPASVRELLAEGVSLAAVNGPREAVLSGPHEAIEHMMDRLAAGGIRGVRLATSHAYHSPAMADAAARFTEVLATVRLAEPTVPLVSCATGGSAEAGQLTEPAFWADQITTPVLFSDATKALLAAAKDTLVLEVGPGTALTNLIRTTPAARHRRATARPLLGRHRDPRAEYATVLRLLGELWQGGGSLDLSALSVPSARRIALPGYPFDRRRHFVDRPATPDGDHEVTQAAGTDSPAEAAEVAGERTGQYALHQVTWTRASVTVQRVEAGPAEDALALLPSDPDAARRMLAVMQRSGMRPVRVRTPNARSGSDPQVDVTDRDAVFDLVATYASRGTLPRTIVHGLLLAERDEFDGDQSAGLTSLLWLIQALARHRGTLGGSELRLVVLTRNGADVTGAETVDPARAMVSGLLHTARLEIDGLRCELIDVGARSDPDLLVHVITRGREPHEPHEPHVAIRGTDLWLPALRELDGLFPRQSLMRRGVYLITGGLGALGRLAAQSLADTGLEPRVALLGRSAGLADPAVTDFVADLEMSGAEVEVLAADVADQGQLEAAISRIHERFGPINGVLHAAGVAGDGLLELRRADQVGAVLRPKVEGGLLLHRLLAGEPTLHFVVHFGSQAALGGLVGSGDYAAANAYLNALAQSHAGDDCHVVSVNWPGWAGAGMAARSTLAGEAAAGDARHVVVGTWTGAEWFLDEHRVAGVPVLPGAGYLDLILTTATRTGLFPPDRPATVDELTFLDPLAVPAETEVAIQFAAVDRRLQATVLSRPTGGPQWRRHATANLRSDPVTPEDVDPTDFEAHLVAGSAVGVDTDGSIVRFGPRWQAVDSAVRDGGDIWASLRLSEKYHGDLDRALAHPALVDLATSVAAHRVDRPYLPFHYREAVLFRPLPAEVYVRNRTVTPAGEVLVVDVSVHDRSGAEVLRINGFTMRPVDADAFERAVTATPEESGPTAGLLPPREGAALLMRIIQSATPATVAVRRRGEPLDGYLLLDRRTAQVRSAVATVTTPPEPAARPSPGRREAPGETAPAAVPAAVPAGGDSVEDRIRAVWQQLLGMTDVADDVDFFDIGGSSLDAVQMVARIKRDLGVQLSVATVFEMGTIRQLADEVQRLGVHLP